MYRKPGFGDQPNWIREYTSSLEFDRKIYSAVVLTALAHLFHLWEKGLIPEEAGSALKCLVEALDKEDEVLSGEFEDVHEALEAWLLDKAGKHAGWLAYGKSRNDQVSTALRLALRKEIIRLLWEINRLRGTLLGKAERNLNVLIPAFTHLRPAQPSTVAHYLLHVEREVSVHWRTLWYLLREVIDLSPLGSGPVAGSSVPLDRGRLAELLGFSGVEENTIFATGSRTFASLVLGSIASLAVALSRVAEDLIVWSTSQFSIVRLPDRHVSTSSIMPQKRNPVTLEIIRAVAGDILGSLTSFLTITKGIPSGYNLDLQEANNHIFGPLEKIINAIKVMADLIDDIEFREVRDIQLLAQDVAERLVKERGIAYREAHSLLAKALRENGWDLKKAVESLDMELPGFEEAINSRGRGGPNPERMSKEISSRRKLLRDDIGRLTEFESLKLSAERELVERVRRTLERKHIE